MLKDLAWNTFKKTGNIETYMELVKVKNIEDNIKAEYNGNCKNEGNYHI